MFVFVMISVVCLHNRLTLCLSLDVVPSVLRYLLAIKNCFYRLIKCFYFHRTRFLVVVNGVARVCVSDVFLKPTGERHAAAQAR